MLVLTFYLPFLGAGLHLFDGARNYGRDWSNNASFFQLLEFVARSKARADFFAGLMALAAIGYLAKKQAGLLWSSLVLTGEYFWCRQPPILGILRGRFRFYVFTQAVLGYS